MLGAQQLFAYNSSNLKTSYYVIRIFIFLRSHSKNNSSDYANYIICRSTLFIIFELRYLCMLSSLFNFIAVLNMDKFFL